MKITNCEHEIISKYLPNYNREKSYIECETLIGGYNPEFFVVKIFRKGRFEYKNGTLSKIR